MMGLHKLTAGDGYLYLIRQVAAGDATDLRPPQPGRLLQLQRRNTRALDGPRPGRPRPAGQPRSRRSRWSGELWSVPDGSQVREDQMKALFGEGLHPNADQITRHLTGVGVAKAGALAAARLGRPFRVDANENEWTRRLRAAYGDYNTTLGAERTAPRSPTTSAPDIRTAVGREMFTENYGRPPADDRELSGFIARQSRAANHRRRRL